LAKSQIIFDEYGNCTIKDKDFTEINISDEDRRLKEKIGSEFAFDDFIISTLISLSPKTIQVFNAKKIPIKLKDTLVGIFEDRVLFSNKKEKKT